eukprot:scaffold2771_cov252-Pinguiococcus_pyrenoidosus.AAC.19
MSESFHRTQVLLHTLKMGEDLKKSSRKPEQQEHIGKVLDALREEAVVSFSFLASHFLEQSDSMRQSLKYVTSWDPPRRRPGRSAAGLELTTSLPPLPTTGPWCSQPEQLLPRRQEAL